MIPCIYKWGAAGLVDSDAAQECLAAAPHLITGSLPDLKHYGARCTCLPAVSTSQTSIKTSSAGWARETERRSQRDARTSHPSHHKKFSSQGYGPPSEKALKEWRMRVCQVQTTKRGYLTHPSSTCPLQWHWHHLNHLNPPQHDLWQVTHHSNTRTFAWDDCGTAYLAENTTRLTMWFIQNYSSSPLLHTEHLPIVHRGPGN